MVLVRPPPIAFCSMSLMFSTPILAPGRPGISKLPRPLLVSATKCIQHALFSVHVRARLNALAHLLAREPDGNRHEIAHDLLHVAADIAHFGKLGGLHLDEGGAGELGEPARNLSLAHAGRAD